MKTDLTPTEELMMDALSARHRLGNPTWTFSTRVSPTAQRLEHRGFVSWKYGVVEDTIMVSLTEEGKREWFSESHDTPVSKTPTELHDDLFPDYEPCYSRGPRISGQDEKPLCLEPWGTEHLHRGYPGSGFDNEVWGDPVDRDQELAEEWRRRQARKQPEPEERTACYVTAPHPPHAWDTEERSRLRYHCQGVEA